MEKEIKSLENIANPEFQDEQGFWHVTREICQHYIMQHIGLQEVEDGKYMPLANCMECGTSRIMHDKDYQRTPMGNTYVARVLKEVL